MTTKRITEPTARSIAQTNLYASASAGDLKGIVDALRLWADINHGDENKVRALAYAAGYGRVHAVELLLKRGAAIDHQDHYGCTALMYAAMAGHLRCVALLIKAGARVEIKSSKGLTALMVAAMEGHLSTVKCIVGYGADILTEAANGETALSMAYRNGHKNVAEYLTGCICLHAARIGDVQAIDALVNCDRGTVITGKRIGLTALRLATKYENKAVVKYLKKHITGH